MLETHTTPVAIIGAGPAGLTAGYVLSGEGRKVTIFEADPVYVGGISRTVQNAGYCVDIGGHRFFSKSKEVVDLWREIMGDALIVRRRKSRIFYRGKFYPYPLDISTTLRNLGVIESALCVLSYVKAICFPVRDPKTFQDWVSNRFGKKLFGMFFKTYTEKVWGMRCDQLSADWAAQRINKLSLFSAMKNMLMRALNIRPKGDIKTLIEEFLYPRKGPGMMWEKATRDIVARGSDVKMGTRVQSLAYDAATQMWHVTYREGEAQCVLHAPEVISTMPLRELVQNIAHAPEEIRARAEKLGYRDFLIVALKVRDTDSFDDQWIYIHSENVKVGRIQNFKSWSPEMVPDPAMSCYGLEYFCFEHDGLWSMSDDALIELAKREIVTLGLAKAHTIEGGFVTRQPKAYPVYDQEYLGHLQAIREWMDGHCPGLQVVGRNGMHKYNNQDHSMMTAMLAARNILAGNRAFDTWRVNQDAEYHESGESTASGASGERQVPKAI